ncbi:hypothetical protein [Nocardia sp. CC227C]|uniref:hypothetical protein n=1 Tax=Nocardia sp. CC227C TaxID=3044562 RepID=UPI00278BDE17|nr:hypothetical protein [Nocardia sp. CC227C]
MRRLRTFLVEAAATVSGALAVAAVLIFGFGWQGVGVILVSVPVGLILGELGIAALRARRADAGPRERA